MWFELASQKPALHTWGCVRNPRARWSGSACVVCNCERRANCVCVCDSFYKYMPGFVSLKRKYYFACGCILTQEVSWTKPRTNFKSQEYLVALSHISRIFLSILCLFRPLWLCWLDCAAARWRFWLSSNFYLHDISGSRAGGRNEPARSSYFLLCWLFD